MPLTPSYGDRRIGPIRKLYRHAEKKLLTWLAKTVTPGPGHGWAWAYAALSRLLRFGKGVRGIISDTETEMIPRVSSAVRGAWRDGLTEARRDVGPAPPVGDARPQQIIDETTEVIRSVHAHVPQVMDDAYREIVNAAVHPGETGEDARRNAVQRALEMFARRGITGFVDRRGRRYDLVTYVEIAVRSAITRAEVDAYCAQAAAAGHDLFIVSDVRGACDRCRPFENRLISISGQTIGAISRNTASGRAVRVEVMCSLAEARERGLFHPGCRHEIKIWTPDDPAPPRSARPVSDAERIRRRRANAAARSARRNERVRYVARR